MRKSLLSIIALAVSASMLVSCSSVEPTDVSVLGLKGPTSMGLVSFAEKIEEGELKDNNYSFEMIVATDEVAAKLAKKEIDIAAVPANLASVLYNNLEGEVKVVAVNTLGVLYIAEKGESVSEIADLKGKTIIASGKGATPEIALRYILSENGIDPDNDVIIDWKTEQSECVAALATSENAVAMLPQPFVTTAISKNNEIRIALDLTSEWEKIQEGKEEKSSLITGVLVARTEFAEENPEALDAFLGHYKKSVDFVNENLEEGAKLVEAYDIVPYSVALKAIPDCNIVCITGDELEKKLSGYLSVLFEQNPKSVGGELPDEEFYYNSK